MRFLRRLRVLFKRRRFEAELDEELRFHLESAAEERRQEGVDPAAARVQARRQFGNSTALRETTRDLFAFRHAEAVWRDACHGVRSLRRNPVMVLVAVLSIGLGTGAAATFYSLIDSLLIHDVTAGEPERLVRFNGISYPNYQEIRARGVFQDLAAFNIGSLLWRNGGQTSEAIVHYLSANFFEVTGVHAALGRTFTAEEAAPERNPRVVLVSHRFWQERLAGDASVLGRVLSFNRTAYTVIGVLPAGYRSIQGLGVRPDVFMPFSTDRQPNLFQRQAALLLPVGRLRPSATVEQTHAALMSVLRDLEQRFPNRLDEPQALRTVTASALSAREGRPIVAFTTVLGAVVVMVLLIACANVAGLLLARGASRRREIAVRAAMGGTRGQIVRQLLIESAMVAAAGTLAGLLFTALAAAALGRVTLPGMPVGFTFVPDWRLGVTAAALGIAATLLSGVLPALASSRPNLADALHGNRALAPRLRLRSVLVAAQIAVTVTLLTGALLFLHNLVRVLRLDPGFDIAHTLWIDVVTDRDIPAQERLVMRDRIRRDLESAAGVESVSWAWYLPFNIEFPEPLLRRADGSNPVDFRATEQGIGPDYLKTMRIPLLAGREFSWSDLDRDNAKEPEPVLVNEAFVHAYFPEGNPLGRRLARVPPAGTAGLMTVIGVSANTSFRNPGEEPVPLLQSLQGHPGSFLVRPSGSAGAAARSLAGVIRQSAPGAAVGTLTVAERWWRGTWPARAAATLLGLFAALGLVLALIGLCGASLYDVARRRSEIGIRMALGATAGDVLRLMLRDSMALVAAGGTAGLLLAAASTRPLGRFLSGGMRTADPLAYTAMLAILLAAAALSVWLPSRRAARVDPSESLRAD